MGRGSWSYAESRGRLGWVAGVHSAGSRKSPKVSDPGTDAVEAVFKGDSAGGGVWAETAEAEDRSLNWGWMP